MVSPTSSDPASGFWKPWPNLFRAGRQLWQALTRTACACRRLTYLFVLSLTLWHVLLTTTRPCESPDGTSFVFVTRSWQPRDLAERTPINSVQEPSYRLSDRQLLRISLRSLRPVPPQAFCSKYGLAKFLNLSGCCLSSAVPVHADVDKCCYAC